MVLKLNICNAFSRKVGYIILILLLSISFSFGGALAKSCEGGPDCSNCVELAHSHVPGKLAGMENYGCRTSDKNGTCGFEAGRSTDKFNRIALTVRSDHSEFSGNLVAKSVDYSQPILSGKCLLQFDSPDMDGSIPIYLLTKSLLC